MSILTYIILMMILIPKCISCLYKNNQEDNDIEMVIVNKDKN